MTIKNESFLLLEKSLSSKLDKSMRRGYIPALKKSASAARKGNFNEAREHINSIDVSPNIENKTKFINLIGMQAILFGAKDFKSAKNSSFYNQPPPEQLEKATKTIVMMLSVNANEGIKKQAHKLLDIEEANQKESEFTIQKSATNGFVREFVSNVGKNGKSFIDFGSSLHTSRLASWGFTVEAGLSGATAYKVSEVLDSRICPVCDYMNGKVFPVASARKKLEGLLDVTDPDQLKSIAKWPTQSKEGIANLQSMSDSELITAGWDTPPFHPLAVSQDTEFLSNSGWKLVKDATNKDLAFSMNPETRLVSWVPVVQRIKTTTTDNRMIHFISQNSDLLVTSEHQQCYETRLKNGTKVIRITDAQHLKKLSKVTLPKQGVWVGTDREFIDIGGRIVKFEILVEFLAYWISDGCVNKRGKNSYSISISTRKYQSKVNNTLTELIDGKVYSRKTKVECSDTILGKWLLKYVGKLCRGKRVPDIVLNSTPELITVFLNAYLQADGSVVKTNGKYGNKGSRVRTFYTANKKLEHQLCELIVKVGGTPSCTTQHNPQRVLNGRVIKPSTVYRIRWCTSKTATFGKSGKGDMVYVPYTGYVYCLELETNHIFYSRRNGKCIWTGNCRGILRKTSVAAPPTVPIVDLVRPAIETAIVESIIPDDIGLGGVIESVTALELFEILTGN